MADLNAKYQRLAAEYGKVRGQVQVLKKAVVDQKEQIGRYQEEIRLKDQEARRKAQEVESSQFRNQQMSRRIQVRLKNFIKILYFYKKQVFCVKVIKNLYLSFYNTIGVLTFTKINIDFGSPKNKSLQYLFKVTILFKNFFD